MKTGKGNLGEGKGSQEEEPGSGGSFLNFLGFILDHFLRLSLPMIQIQQKLFKFCLSISLVPRKLRISLSLPIPAFGFLLVSI